MPKTFPKSVRLLTKSDFDQVFNRRKSRADRRLVVYTAPNQQGHARLGLVVSRKVGNAVVRNRWKRLLREAFRLLQDDLPAVDLVCLPRPRAEPKLAELIESLRKLSRQ